MVAQRFIRQTWVDGEEYTFMAVSEESKQGLVYGDYVCLLTGIQSVGENTRIYGYVRDLSVSTHITIWVERTVIDPNIE